MLYIPFLIQTLLQMEQLKNSSRGWLFKKKKKRLQLKHFLFKADLLISVPFGYQSHKTKSVEIFPLPASKWTRNTNNVLYGISVFLVSAS